MRHRACIVLLCGFLSLGCRMDSEVIAPGQGTVSATANPQVALYSFVVSRSASVAIEFGTDTTYGLHTWAQSTPGGQPVRILVAGMKAHTTYHMRADATFADGTQYFDVDHTFTTGGLPAHRIPQITATNPNGLTPSPGVVLFHLWPGTSNQINVGAVDMGGNLIWYYDYDPSLGQPEPVKLLPNGHMLMLLSIAGVREVDLAGNIISQFTGGDVSNWLSAAGFNLTLVGLTHDILPLPNGHLILLASHTKNFTDLPGYPGVTAVAGDELIDLDQNRKPVWVWDTFDHLDINRHPMYFPDWTHANAVVYSPDDGDLVLSMRHQSWVIKIDYANGSGTGNILWRLGYQGDFTLTNGDLTDWFSAQHYVNFVSPNTAGIAELAVFDNGDNRVLDAAGNVCGAAGQPPCYSRVPIFQIDEVEKTATLLWQDNLSPVYSFWGGSVQQMENNNVVFGETTPSDNLTGARYLEVTHDPVPEVVLHLEVFGQNSYRSVHLPSLYPGVQW